MACSDSELFMNYSYIRYLIQFVLRLSIGSLYLKRTTQHGRPPTFSCVRVTIGSIFTDNRSACGHERLECEVHYEIRRRNMLCYSVTKLSHRPLSRILNVYINIHIEILHMHITFSIIYACICNSILAFIWL
jgi:hypothetical protein